MKKGDFIIIAIALLIMLGVFLGYKIFQSFIGDDLQVEIRYGKQVIKTVDLTNDVDLEILVVDGKVVQEIDRTKDKDATFNIPDGHYNIVKIYNNGIQVIEANCEEQIDVHKGFVKDPYHPIICLPHNLEVIIVAADSDKLPDFDGEL